MEEVSERFSGKGMKFNIVYDRSELIEESISSIKTTLIEEMIVVSLIVIIFYSIGEVLSASSFKFLLPLLQASLF
ncbi:MAG: efflux RND transporter permease subunit [Cytophagales bacterium]|nr:efflux RND transporter permease subunit [Cytophagales bacterium]